MVIYPLWVYYGRADMIWLNYVGEGAYKDDSKFIAEAKKHGAQRACSWNMVKRLIKSRSIIYYARYDEDHGAIVFARGKVIGFSTTMPLEYLGLVTTGSWNLVDRGCGSYLAKAFMVDDIEQAIEDIEESTTEEQRRAHKWFINTDIEEYETIVENIITYKVREREMIADDIAFTRGFICLNGYVEGKGKDEGAVWQIKRYRPYHGKVFKPEERAKEIAKRYMTDESTKLDKWLG